MFGEIFLQPNSLEKWEPYKKCNQQCDEDFNPDDVDSCHSYTLCPSVGSGARASCTFKNRKYTGDQPLRETTKVSPGKCITMYRKCEEGISKSNCYVILKVFYKLYIYLTEAILKHLLLVCSVGYEFLESASSSFTYNNPLLDPNNDPSISAIACRDFCKKNAGNCGSWEYKWGELICRHFHRASNRLTKRMKNKDFVFGSSDCSFGKF